MPGENLELERIARRDVIPAESVTLQPRDYRYSGSGYGYGEEEKVHLRELWRMIRKRQWLIISIVLTATTLVAIQMYRMKPVYQASTILEIGKDNAALARSGDLVIDDDSDPYYQVNVKTKVLSLNSRQLHEDVVADLQLDQNPEFAEAGSGGSVWSALKAARRTSDQTQDPAESANPNDRTSDNRQRSSEESARLAPYVEALEENLVTEPLRETRALKVSFSHSNPVLAAAVANGIARRFIDNNFQNKTEKFAETATWLDSTTRELKSKVERAEQALANYTRENNIFSINDDRRETTTLTTAKLARLHDQALRAETERMLKQSLYEELKAGHLAQLPEAFTDPKLMDLQKQLNELQLAAAQLSVKFAPKNPKVAEIQQQISEVKTQIDESRAALEDKLKIEYERAVKDEQSFKALLAYTKDEAIKENQAAIQYNILKQDVDTARGLYTDFLQKTNQAKAQVAEQHNNIRVIERATPPNKPVGPKRALMILLGFMVSLMGSVGLVFLLEYLDNTIKNVEDVSRYVQLPALGIIPPFSAGGSRQLPRRHRRQLGPRGPTVSTPSGKLNNEQLALDSRSTAAEAYRALRTSVLLSSAGSPPKTVLVTSSQPGEGKTTTVVNTAMSLAQLGASVLIIDCDLRKPSVHKVFRVSQAAGLSTYLSRDAEIDRLIQKLPMPNISLLPCGPVPPNPAELISADKMREMLAMLAERYDHILIDSPPIINVTDAVILSRLVDGVILVVHGGKSSREVVRRGRQELDAVGAKIFGVVLNNLDLHGEGYYEGYYRGNYGSEPQTVETTI